MEFEIEVNGLLFDVDSNIVFVFISYFVIFGNFDKFLEEFVLSRKTISSDLLFLFIFYQSWK